MLDLTMCLSDAMDMIAPAVVNHHREVAYIAFALSLEMGLPENDQRELVLAGLMHDAGALHLKDKLNALRFEVDSPQTHAEYGYRLLKKYKPFERVAQIVRYHHVWWKEGCGAGFTADEPSLGNHILHLADRVAVLINRKKPVLSQATEIVDLIDSRKETMFMPELVDLLRELADKEYFWLDAVYPSVYGVLRRRAVLEEIELDIESLLDIAGMFSQIIDFRSPFTASHSSMVAASAEALAEKAGFSENECRMMRTAGFVHDLGKLAVPTEILEKPGPLTRQEFDVVRNHTFFTYRTLERIKDLGMVNAWAAFHHERLDGSGYPFHLNEGELSLGSRIMAVADVFCAITEDRPYRKGMDRNEATGILKSSASNRSLDPMVVGLLLGNYEEISNVRLAARQAAARVYEQFQEPPT